MNLERVEVPFGEQNLIIETGRFAKQANGAVTVTCGGTVVLVTACIAREKRPDIDFMPLMVEYREKTYAAGRIPGGFFKREGRPSESEILAARLIDRPIRPLFPQGLRNEVQVVALVLSHDGENDPDVLAAVGASVALMISDIPFDGPIGAVRVGMVEDQFILNPTYAQRETSPLDVIVMCHNDQVVMIEGEAKEVSEETVMQAITFGLEQSKNIVHAQKELAKKIGKKKLELDLNEINSRLIEKLKSMCMDSITKIYKMSQKEDREEELKRLMTDLTSDMSVFTDCASSEDEEITIGEIKGAIHEIEAQEIRRIILDENRRVDGRGFNDLRPLSSDVQILPRTHGSGLFTRGQTQSLSITTLGTRSDEQIIDDLEGKSFKTFMLHYNFPSFSVGEARPMRGPGRREIGHGALAEKAIRSVMPSKEDFPYTIRVVSEILESNGSSSMATVCAGILALMDAGVPIKDAVAGISIGLIAGEKTSVLLTDIMGVEDHFGDMDFKVAGTRKGVTAIQLDLKICGITIELLTKAIEQARTARLAILDNMHQTISAPREELSSYAPRITTLKISTEKIGDLIGPGGKMIKKIIEETGVDINIEDDGTVFVASTDAESSKKAIAIIESIVEEPEVGKVYDGTVKRIMNFGAFCEFLPGREGLVHISELSDSYVKDINKVVKVGDQFKVKVIEIDDLNRINLSRKQAEPKKDEEDSA